MLIKILRDDLGKNGLFSGVSIHLKNEVVQSSPAEFPRSLT